MKKLIISIIALVIINKALSQNKFNETEKLYATAKLWGFLKYYHPQIASGKLDFDNELFKILDEQKKINSRDELSDLFLDWINGLGKVEKCDSCKMKSIEKYFDNNFDLTWISNEHMFNDELSKLLYYIEENRYQGKQYYVSTNFGVGNINITNENNYLNFDWKDKKLRLLSLFRYWNIIEYFYPYKYLTDDCWDNILIEMIPKFLNVKSELEYHLALLELIVKIDDSHAAFSTEITKSFFGKKMIPYKFEIVDNTIIINGYYNLEFAKINGLKIGDLITHVNGESIERILKKNHKYISASNPSTKIRNSYFHIFNGSTDFVEVDYKRNNSLPKTLKIRRYNPKEFNYKSPDNESWKIIENTIGYVNMGSLQKSDVSQIMKELMTKKAIIFDIRNYPKGTMYLIANFLNKSPKEFAKFTIPDLSYPGKFIWTDPVKCGASNKNPFNGKVILLVNENTQSHAEFTCMCLKTADNVTIIGSQTAGADGNVSRFKMVGGFDTVISGIGVYYPNGEETQRVGIVPNILVKPTIEGLKLGKDEVLEKAIEFILDNK